MTDRGLLIVVSGPSGVGKDTVLSRFLPTAERCVRSVSATTRAPRENETHGVDYFFLSREEFEALAARGEMLEYALYDGNYYGTPKQNVLDQLARGKHVILKIEVNGAMQVRERCPDAVLVFIAPPDWQTLVSRLSSRGTESPEALATRLATAKFELSKACEYDYIIVNEQCEQCHRRLLSVVEAAECSASHMKEFIKEVCTNA